MSVNPPDEETQSFTVRIRGLGAVPSFKNAKRIWKGPKGKLFLGTRDDVKAWMNAAIKSIESQLLSLCQTTPGEMLTAQQVRSLIASLPPDDAWRFIPELRVKAVKCDKEDAGAIIQIDEIQEG